MDSNAVASVLFAAKMRLKSELERQRIAAQFSGDFFKEILPIMYDASIIDKTRFLTLMNCGDLQGNLTSKELLELAIYWKITPNAAEFWKRHKSRDELLRALQKQKEAMDLEERLKAAIKLQPATGESLASPTSHALRGRRSSLVGISQLFAPATADQGGDIFGTHGEYTDGIIYMARRLRMDNESAVAMRAKIQAVNDAVAAGRASKTGDLDKEDDIGEGISHGDEYAAILGDELKGAAVAPSTTAPKAAPEPRQDAQEGKLSTIAEEHSAVFNLPPPLDLRSAESPLRVVGADGHVHRLGTNRFEVSEEKENSSDVPAQAMQRLLARGESLRYVAGSREEPHVPDAIDVEAFVAKYAPVESSENDATNLLAGRLASSRSNSRPTSRAGGFGVRPDEYLEWRGSPGTESPTLGGFPVGPSSGSLSSGDGLIAGSVEGGGIPDKLSKLDLYFRPVRESDKVVVTMNSPTARQPADALDQLMYSGPLSPAEGARTATTARANPNPSVSPYSMEEDPVALRHRLGGRAGRLARTLSGKLKGEISTAEIHLSPSFRGDFAASDMWSSRRSTPPRLRKADGSLTPTTRGGPDPKASPSYASTARSPRPMEGMPATHRFMQSPSSPGDTARTLDVPPIVVDPQDGGLGTVIAGLIDASKSKAAPGQDASGGIGRDVHYDAIVRQVNKLRSQKQKADNQERLQNTYGAAPLSLPSPKTSAVIGLSSPKY